LLAEYLWMPTVRVGARKQHWPEERRMTKSPEGSVTVPLARRFFPTPDQPFIASMANFWRIFELGWSASDTSLFTSATGKSALSYMSQRNFSTFVRMTSRFRRSAGFGDDLSSSVGSDRTYMRPAAVFTMTFDLY